MNAHQEPAFLLYKNPLGEADLIAHLLAAQGGHMQARIKGAKSLQRGFLYNPGDLLLIQYETSETTDFIRLLHHHPLRQQDWSQLRYQASLGWSLLLELVGRLAGKGLDPVGLFALLDTASQWNWRQAAPVQLVLLGLWRLLAQSGVAFPWQACQVCGHATCQLAGETPKFRKAVYRLHAKAGGLACGHCAPGGRIDGAMIKVLWMLEQGLSLDAAPEALLHAWIEELTTYLEAQFQMQIKSLAAWRQARGSLSGSTNG